MQKAKLKGNGAPKREFGIDERRKKVFETWRDNEITLRELAKKFGVSHETIRLDLAAVLDERDKEFDDELKAWKRKQLARLEKLLIKFSKRTTAESGRLVLAVLKEINEITGVKSAVKHEISGVDGTPLFPKDLSVTINSIYGDISNGET